MLSLSAISIDLSMRSFLGNVRYPVRLRGDGKTNKKEANKIAATIEKLDDLLSETGKNLLGGLLDTIEFLLELDETYCQVKLERVAGVEEACAIVEERALVKE